jgi:hypothetical protein
VAAPGRNDPCPCGSGRKFKRCCGEKEEARDPLEVAQGLHALDQQLVERMFSFGRRSLGKEFEAATASCPVEAREGTPYAQIVGPYLAYVAQVGAMSFAPARAASAALVRDRRQRAEPPRREPKGRLHPPRKEPRATLRRHRLTATIREGRSHDQHIPTRIRPPGEPSFRLRRATTLPAAALAPHIREFG